LGARPDFEYDAAEHEIRQVGRSVVDRRKRTARNKREQLVGAAVELAYRQGYRKTTLADLAHESKVPLGNIYYYFKTRDDVGIAVLDWRRGEFATMRARLSELESPLARLLTFVEMTVANAPLVAERGCPMGSLTAELLKDGGELAERARSLMTEPMAWMAEQFAAMGHQAEADDLALQLQSALQGASLLTQTFGKPEPLVREGQRLLAWLRSLGGNGSNEA
jgi:TetR/AcrR family transcriptional regulator, transcriptional repressor for nem operon